jgi:hypothetical protein
MQSPVPLLLAALAFAMPADATTSAVTAGGGAGGEFRIGCSTCPHIVIPLSGMPVQQAAGPSSAQLAYSGVGTRAETLDGYSLGGGAAYAVQAGFEGLQQMPRIGARASADNEWAYILADPDRLPVGIDAYYASAYATTVRQYRYGGATPASYTLNFQVDGTLTTSLSSIFASVALYDGSDPVHFETGLIDIGSVSLAGQDSGGAALPFVASFDVSIDLTPGESFYLLGHLYALAAVDYEAGDVAADAYNTLRIAGIGGGDPALLLAAPVPEPGSALLFLIGLPALAAFGRFNRARPLPRAAS